MVTIINQKDIKEKERKNFSLPIVNKFICCFCMPLKSALNLCTILLLVWFLLRVIVNVGLNNISIKSSIFLGLYVIGIISLGLLFIGIYKNKPKLMLPCKYLYIIVTLIGIPEIIAKYKTINNQPSEDKMENLVKQGFYENVDEIKTEYKKNMTFSFAFEIFMLIFNFYFLYAVWSYSYIVEENNKEMLERQKLEEAIKEPSDE